MENYKADIFNAATVGPPPIRKVLSQFNAQRRSISGWDYKRSKLSSNFGENKENAENASATLSKIIVTEQEQSSFTNDLALSNTCVVKPDLPDRAILVAKRKKKVEESQVKAEDHEKAAEKPEIKRRLPMRQKLECLMGQIDDLFNGKPTTMDLGMTKLVMPDTLATVDPYKMDLLLNELKKESRYSFDSDFPKEFAAQRYEVVTQVIGIAKNNELDHETLQVGIYIVDAFLFKVLQTLKNMENIDLNVLALVAINIASKSQSHTNRSQIVKEIEDIIYSYSMLKRILIPKFNEMEECILKELKFEIVPPTSIILKDLVISQMDFPTPMMQWLTSETASTVLKEAIFDYKLVSVPSSKKAKLVVQICTKYFMREFHNYNFVPWNAKTNLPLVRDDDGYLGALKTVAEFQCGKRFLSYFSTKSSKLSPDLGNSLGPSNMVTRSRAS